jgi:glycosyltransferase involved in cell wall biosynthesis
MLKIACIPAYNEEKVIGDVIKRSLKFVDKVLVYDDGSIDQTSQEAEKAGAIVFRHENNQGKGIAIKTLFENALKMNADISITIDGDGQFLPEEMDRLINMIESEKVDVVIGNRYGDKKEMPRYRKTGNKIFDKITKLASNLPFQDTQSGYRAYSKKAIESIKITTNGFGVDSEILVDAANKGLKISEVPVTVLYNTGQKTSTKNPISHSSGVLSSLLELIAINHPLKFVGLPGFVLFIIGVIFSVIVLTLFNEERVFSIPSTLVALGSLVLGLMLLLMSVVLYSISRMSKNF